MFIDRKINGALIQDLALREEGGRVCVWGGGGMQSVKTDGRAAEKGRGGERTEEEGKD